MEGLLALTIAVFGHCTDRKVLGTKEEVLRGLIFLLDGPESESEGAPSASLVPLLDVQAKGKQCAFEADKLANIFPISAPVLSLPCCKISVTASG